jgi:hypothetical protein
MCDVVYIYNNENELLLYMFCNIVLLSSKDLDHMACHKKRPYGSETWFKNEKE